MGWKLSQECVAQRKGNPGGSSGRRALILNSKAEDNMSPNIGSDVIDSQRVHLQKTSLEGAMRIGCRGFTDDIYNIVSLLLQQCSNNVVELGVTNGDVLQGELRLCMLELSFMATTLR